MSETLLDVRSWPIPDREARLVSALNGLRMGTSLKVRIEYEPRRLHWGFEESRHRFAWRQRRMNDDLWEVTINRIPPVEAHSVDAFFEECGVLAGARRETRSTLARFAVSETVEPNAVIAEHDATWPYLGFLRRGCIFAVITTAIGRDQLIFEVLPHETFGEVTTLDGGGTVARYVAAGEPAEFLIVPREVILNLVGRDGGFACAMSAMCAQRMRSVAARLSAQISRSTISRLASAILPYSPPAQGLAPACAPLLTMNQAQLAIAAGTVKTVANRALSKLEEAGAIERRRGRIVRVDRLKLVTFL